MASDRWLSLLNQAYIEGLLDPKEAQPTDRMWQQKAEWTLDFLEQRNRNEIRKLKHEMNAALLTYSTTSSALDLHWEQAHNLQAAVHKALIPWVEMGGVMSRQQFMELKTQWEAVWGNQNDPRVNEEIQKTTDYLNSMSMQSVSKGLRGWRQTTRS